MNPNEKSESFTERLTTIADDLDRLGKPMSKDDRLFALRKALLKVPRYSSLAMSTLADSNVNFESLSKAAICLDEMDYTQAVPQDGGSALAATGVTNPKADSNNGRNSKPSRLCDTTEAAEDEDEDFKLGLMGASSGTGAACGVD
jgi:hypothetical protein